MDTKNTMSGRRRRWARLGGAVAGVTAAVVLSLGVDAGSASAATLPSQTSGAAVAGSTVGVVHVHGVRWQ